MGRPLLILLRSGLLPLLRKQSVVTVVLFSGEHGDEPTHGEKPKCEQAKMGQEVQDVSFVHFVSF